MIDVSHARPRPGCRRKDPDDAVHDPQIVLHPHHVPMRPVRKWVLLLLADWTLENYEHGSCISRVTGVDVTASAVATALVSLLPCPTRG